MRNLLFILLGLFVYSCSNNANPDNIEIDEGVVKDTVVNTLQERQSEIDKYSALLYKDSLKFNAVYAEKLLHAYDQFIKYNSFQSISKTYQFYAGELADKLGEPNVAIKYFNDLLARDPKHKKAPLALFYKATIIGDELHEDELAKKTYQEFIDKYPNNPLAKDAKHLIEYQGKSLDEIVAGFEKKNS